MAEVRKPNVRHIRIAHGRELDAQATKLVREPAKLKRNARGGRHRAARVPQLADWRRLYDRALGCFEREGHDIFLLMERSQETNLQIIIY